MKALFIAFCVGICCLLSACKGHNNLEKHKEVVAVKTDRILDQRFRDKETVPSTLVRTDNGELYFFDEEIDQLIQQSTKFQLELADLGATNEAVAYKNLGTSYLEQGEPDKAVVAFKKAIQIAPSFVEAYYLLADVYSIKGEGVLSRKSLDQAMALDGSYIIDISMTGREIKSTQSTIPNIIIKSTGVIELPPEFVPDPIKTDIPDR